uniref:Cullin family profile domain-containing protein n=1 Tax=Rhizochromulina marina TaxID=1034831 RepID=A0A7S2W0A7_9STRA
MSDKKKLVIKPFRPHSQMDRNQAEATWSQLRTAIKHIHNRNASTLSFEELYRNAYNLVLNKHGELLYKGVCDCEREHLNAIANSVASTPDELLLGQLSGCWSDHQDTMVMVRDILMYMDRTFVAQQKRTPVYAMGLILFRETIERHPQVRDRLRQILLENVAMERAGQLIDRILMKHTLAMLADLGIDGLSVYEEDFEAHFLGATRNFYHSESMEYISQNTCPDYLTKAKTRLAEEQARVRHYLNKSTESKLKQIAEAELIERHAKTLVDMENSGCVAMLHHNRIEELKDMYELFSRVPGTLEHLRLCMCEYVKKLGRQLLQDQEKTKEPVDFVRRLLGMRDKYEHIVNYSFHAEKKSQKALKEAFEQFINADTRCASYLVLYIDELLKSGLKGMSEDEADAHLEKVIVIFRYLQDKDIFENFYKQHLAKRLLQGRSVSEDAERSMITKLKTECGYQFTSKLEGMFVDMNVSKESMEKYREARRDMSSTRSLDGKPTLDVTVLTAGYWPTQKIPPCMLPLELVPEHKAFENFYLSSNNGRKLNWQTSMGSAEVKGLFGANRHDLIVSTYQMCILMMFNRAPTLSLREFSELKIPDNDLRRHLISLCTPKHRILRKSSKGKNIADDDSFTFNPEYTSKMKRVKIPLVSMKELAPATGGDVPAPVEEDRRLLVEAGVVRIMKARKTLQHNDLIAEVTRQLSSRFMPNPAFIKKRIESLIEREYLERDKTDRRMYKYLA